MKFYVGSKSTGAYFKNEISTKFKKDGGFISLAAVKELFRETPNDDDIQYGWDTDSNLIKKMRVRNCKDGCYLYLPEPNAKICFNKNDVKFDEESYKKKSYEDIPLPNIDVCVFETELFEQLINAINDGFRRLVEEEKKMQERNEEFLMKMQGRIEKNAVIPTVPCTVKARKSGPKAVRVDRPARFHRWVHSTKGVEQELALVSFEDGHNEQVQPDRIIFEEV